MTGTKRMRMRYEQSIRAIACEQQNHRCCYCGVRTNEHDNDPWHSDYRATADHVIPKSAGGPFVIDNIVLACRKCNIEKANTLVTDLIDDYDLRIMIQELAESFHV